MESGEMKYRTELESKMPKQSTLGVWVVIVLLLALIFGKGLMAFFVIGDLGQPHWNYGVVPDVPGESPYAIYQPLPHPQHVRGDKGE
jgi:hypothetical protein